MLVLGKRQFFIEKGNHKMKLLNRIVDQLPVSDVPESVVLYLAGDECLNHCDTLDHVFKRVYTLQKKTYLDSTHTVLHSFHGEPMHESQHYSVTYRNGKHHSFYDLPAVVHFDIDIKMWYKNGKVHRDNGPAIICKHRRKIVFICSGHELELKDSQVFFQNNILIRQIDL